MLLLTCLLGLQVVSLTPAPQVTADAEPWYLSGEPITYAGTFYYPAGPQVFFNPNEMVRSGFYMGVPLYSRTTLEPYSIVFVPLSRGLMQPYEPRRSGTLTGTSGSTAPSFPTAAAAADVRAPIEAPGAPTAVAGAPDAPQPVGTTGQRTRIGPPPKGINAVYIEYEGRRWYRAGDPVDFDTTRMRRVGERAGFPVYVARGEADRIYVPISAGSSLVLPYSPQRTD